MATSSTMSDDAMDRVDQWLDHCDEVGTASMLPSRAFPGLIIMYTVWRGKLNKNCSIWELGFL